MSRPRKTIVSNNRTSTRPPRRFIFSPCGRPTTSPAILLSRLNRTPALIQQGITNLNRKDANPPKLWTENAIEGAKGGISFLDSLPEHPKVQAAAIDPNTLRRRHRKGQERHRRFRDLSRTPSAAAQQRQLRRRRRALQFTLEEKTLPRTRRAQPARFRREPFCQDQAGARSLGR